MSINFRELQKLIEETGAIPERISLGEFEAKIRDLGEIEFADGEVFFGDRKAVIYIKDNKHNEERNRKNGMQNCNSMKEFLNSPAHLNKFHYYRCKTINDMIESGRFASYVATNRQDGLFLINATFGKQVKNNAEVKLWSCQHCLKEYIKNKFPTAKEISRQKMRELLNKFHSRKVFADDAIGLATLPKDSEFDRPPNEYSEDWAKISWKKRNSQNWTCEKCKVNLKNNTRLLHVHHKNGNKWDNSWKQNLQVLCYLCHANQPMHEHMKQHPEYPKAKEIIEVLRPKQRP